MSKKKQPTNRPTGRTPAGRTPARTTATQTAAQKRLAAQRAMAAASGARGAKRQRMLTRVALPITAVVVIAAILIIAKVVTGAGSPKSGAKSGQAAGAVVTAVTSVPASVLDKVGKGSSSTPPTTAAKSPALTLNGKPEILYAGAEYCPYCATERWAMVIALSRFGTFQNLGATTSSPTDSYPSTQTFSFHGATYTSKYLSFVGKELQTNQVENGQYTALDKLSAADEAIFETYDSPPYVGSTSKGSIPFVDLGGVYFIHGAEFDPQVLQGKTRAQIAADLSKPTSKIAQGADGAANVITAALCKVTKNQPSAVCTSAGVTTAASALGGSSG